MFYFKLDIIRQILNRGTKIMASEKMTLSSKEDFDLFLSKNKMTKKEVPTSFPCNLNIIVIDDDISGIDGIDYEITYDASVENKHAVANKKEHEYQGFHATGDIILNNYPKDLLDIVERSIQYSNLNVVNKMVHDFGGAVTAVWILSESHFIMSIFKSVKNIFNNPFNSTQNALQYTH